jgi:phage/plasmid-associated DNA primase
LESGEGFVVPEASKRLLGMHREESNPARMFLKENYQYDPEYQFGVSKQSLYDGYAKWCNAKGYQKLNDRNFGKEVRREFPQVTLRRMGGHSSDTRYTIHRGLKVYPGAEVLRFFNRK